MHVPYKGSSGIPDLIAGRVGLTVTSMSIVIPHVRTGKLRALGVTTAQRLRAAPDIPTIAETLPGYESIQWSGLLALASRDAARHYWEIKQGSSSSSPHTGS